MYQKVSQFVAVELSAIYHDVVKDRLYTDPANSLRRRSTQTTLHILVANLCKTLAPILAFTADEAWEFVKFNTQREVMEMIGFFGELTTTTPVRRSMNNEKRYATSGPANWHVFYDTLDKRPDTGPIPAPLPIHSACPYASSAPVR